MTSPRAAAVPLADVTTLSTATLSSERTVPVGEAFAPLFGGPDVGLVRGQVVACNGQAAATIALALAAEAVRKGAWLVVVDVPWLGVEAAAELGVPLERLVGVDTRASGSPSAWVDAMGAAADGFDLIITSVPRVGMASARRVHQRVKARGAVLLTLSPDATVASRDRRRSPGATVASRDRQSSSDATVASGDTSAGATVASRDRRSSSDATVAPRDRAAASLFVPDIQIDAVDTEWTGLGDGHGHLAGRRVRAVATGRRWPRQRSTALWLPAPSGRVEPVDESADVIPWRAAR